MAHIFWPRTDLVTRLLLACVASVSVRFRSKERGTRVKDRAKNGVSKRAGRGWRRKEGNFLPSPPSPTFHFFALVPFFARPKSKIPFLGLSLLRNQTETIATQARFLPYPNPTYIPQNSCHRNLFIRDETLVTSIL